MNKEFKMSFDNKIWNVDLEHNKSMEFIIFDDVGGYKTVRIDFKVIEEQQSIDIQAIEELKPSTVFDTKETIKNHYNKINELVQAVKQLDRNIREER